VEVVERVLVEQVRLIDEEDGHHAVLRQLDVGADDIPGGLRALARRQPEVGRRSPC
jgi:hypothetical protein